MPYGPYSNLDIGVDMVAICIFRKLINYVCENDRKNVDLTSDHDCVIPSINE